MQQILEGRRGLSTLAELAGGRVLAAAVIAGALALAAALGLEISAQFGPSETLHSL